MEDLRYVRSVFPPSALDLSDVLLALYSCAAGPIDLKKQLANVRTEKQVTEIEKELEQQKVMKYESKPIIAPVYWFACNQLT